LSCTYTEKDNPAYLERFQKKAAEQRIPLSGSLDLTSRCNLDCIHCFLGEDRTASKKEFSVNQWLGIIDELTEAGCLYLLMTGGEPLLKRGFAEIYTHAKKNGLIVNIFTNGTLVDADTVTLFKDLPPQAVEISLYGASRDAFESITGKTGSYERCLSGIRMLVDNDIRVKLKTVLMSGNIDEFHDIETIAAELNVPFRLDAAIFPRLDHDKAPLDLRVAPEDAVKKEISDPVRLSQWREYYEKRKADIMWTANDPIYRCMAGVTNFHIDAYGRLKPCLMVDRINVDLSETSFLKGWTEVIPQIRDRKAESGFQCAGCEKILLCGYCPAFFELETGREDVPSDYICKTAEYRYEAVVGSINAGNAGASDFLLSA